MNTIISQFVEKCTKNFYGAIEKIVRENGTLGDLTISLKKDFDELGVKLVQFALESVDNELCNDSMRKKSWCIDKKLQEKTLTTIFGDVHYQRTYFVSKFGKGYSHLCDRIFGIEPHERCDLNVKAKMVENAIDMSYEKSSRVFESKMSKQTVLNSIREIENDRLSLKAPIEKLQVEVLYVDADEDHVALQDGSSVMPYLAYVHEGYVDKDKPRKELKNIRYFSGMYRNSEEFWLEVANYIEENYDTGYLKAVYLAGDGAAWIKQGVHWLPKVKIVLDKYHLNKYIVSATGNVPEMRTDIWRALYKKDLNQVKNVFDDILICADSLQRIELIKKTWQYIKGNWEGIINSYDTEYIGCSAEGHVSHILSERLSSRPLGWSYVGVDDMAKLRAFRANNGNIYEVIKGQKKDNKRNGIKKITQNAVKKIAKNVDTVYTDVKPIALENGLKTELYKALHAICYAI